MIEDPLVWRRFVRRELGTAVMLLSVSAFSVLAQERPVTDEQYFPQ